MLNHYYNACSNDHNEYFSLEFLKHNADLPGETNFKDFCYNFIDKMLVNNTKFENIIKDIIKIKPNELLLKVMEYFCNTEFWEFI